VFDIGAIGDCLSVLNNPIADTPLGVLERKHEDLCIGDIEGSFGQVDVFPRTGEFRHIDWEIRIGNDSRKRIHDEIGVATSGKVKRKVVAGVVQRTKEWNALDVIEVKVAEEDMSANGLIAEFLLQLLSKQPDSGAAIENQNLITFRTNFDA
jgi:hypothetical protein